MGITLKAAGQKRMDNSAEENERHCQVETAGLFVAFTKHLVQAGIRRHRIVLIERNGKMAVLGFPPRRQTKRLSFLPRAENESACFLAITHSNGKIQTCPGKNARGTEQAVMPA